MGFKRRFLRLEIDPEEVNKPACTWDDEHGETRLKLLRAYAPRLHFAEGERFFPMNVEAFIESSALRYQLRGPDLTLKDKSIVWADMNSQKKCEGSAVGKNGYRLNNLYLQFVHEFNLNSVIRIGTIVLVLILLGAIGLAIQPGQLPVVEMPSQLESIELKFGLFAALVVAGVSFQYNRKAFLGLLAFLFAVMFFGDPLIIQPGLLFISLALALTLFWFIISWLLEWFMETGTRKASILFTVGSLYILSVPVVAFLAETPVRNGLYVLYFVSAAGWVFFTRRGFRDDKEMIVFWIVHTLISAAVFFFLESASRIASVYHRPAREWLVFAGLMTMFPFRAWIRRMHWSEVSAMQATQVEKVKAVDNKDQYRHIKFLGEETLVNLIRERPEEMNSMSEAKAYLSSVPQKLEEEVSDEAFRRGLKMSTKERFEATTGVAFHEELMPVIVLFIVVHFLVLWHMFGPELLQRWVPEGDLLRSAVFAIQIALTVSAVLWYFLDPLPNPSILGSKREKAQHELTKRELRSLSGRPGWLLRLRIAVLDLLYFSKMVGRWFGKYRQYFVLVIVSTAVWLLGAYANYRFPDSPYLAVTFPFLYRLSLLVVFVITIILVGERAMGFVLDLLSIQPDTLSTRAYAKYSKIRLNEKMNNDGKDKFYCYGRVFKEKSWTILFYQYFYAYNDWRSSVGGINNHEGDWEAVAVYVRSDWNSLLLNLDRGTLQPPVGMALSQHHAGVFKFWEDWYWDEDGQKSRRPNIYVARGSHANYAKPDRYTTEKFFEGGGRKVIASVDTFIRRSRGQIGFEGKGLPEEFADGEGEFFEDDCWEIKLINSEFPGWMQYRGLWGSKVYVKDESGPLGPFWAASHENKARPEEEQMGVTLGRWTRLRWDLLRWKDSLLLDMVTKSSLSPDERRRAVKALSGR